MIDALSVADARTHLLKALAVLPLEAAAAPRPVLLAVSGGPDSLALLLLAAANREPLLAAGFSLAIATVDHRLRDGSAAEAAFVARTAADLGLPHRTIRWDGPKPIGNLAAEARAARYRLLAGHAKAIGARAVLTAHHEDDQIETHHLAKLRRAGDRGLAGMPVARSLAPGVRLLRPFLGVPGAALKRTVSESGFVALDDPTNRDLRFERARLRASLVLSADERRHVLARITAHAARRDAEDAALGEVICVFRRDERLAVDPCGIVRLDRHAFRAMDEAVADVLLSRILRAAGGAEYVPPRVAVKQLRLRLRDGSVTGATLGGTTVRSGDALLFHREYGRNGPPDSAFAGTPTVSFDRRMTVHRPDERDPDVRLLLTAFGRTGRGNAVEKTLPVAVSEDGAVVAAHDRLLRKLPAAVLRLEAREDVSSRLWADLSGAGAS